MKSFFVKTFLPVFFFISALISVVQLIQSQNQKMVSIISNPYFKVLLWSLGGCIIIFIGRYLYVKYLVGNNASIELKEDSKNGFLLSLYIIGIVFAGIILILLFNGNSQYQATKTMIKDSVVYHYDTIKVYDTIPVYEKTRNKNNKQTDEPKFDLSHAKIDAPTQVGDHNTQNNTFNAEHTLTENDKLYIVEQIENIKKQFKLINNCIHLCITMGSNGQKIMKQLEDFLPSKGYEITNHAFIPGSFNNITYNQDEGCVMIIVGVF